MKFLACCVLPDKKLCGNCLYWLNIPYWKIFHLALKTRVCSEIFHCIEHIFYHSGFLSNLRLPWKTKFALNSLFEYIFFIIQNCWATWACPKNKIALKIFTVLKYIFHSGFLSNLRLPWKTELPWSFSMYGNVFIIQDFWATCACPENRVCPEFTVLNIYFLSSRIFKQLALALKNRAALKFFTVWKCFYHSGFLSNLCLPRKQSLPWNFSRQGGGRPPTPRSPASYAYENTYTRISCDVFGRSNNGKCLRILDVVDEFHSPLKAHIHQFGNVVLGIPFYVFSKTSEKVIQLTRQMFMSEILTETYSANSMF